MKSEGSKARQRVRFVVRAGCSFVVAIAFAAGAQRAFADDVDELSECGIFEEWVASDGGELVFVHAAAGTPNDPPDTYTWVNKDISSNRRGEVHNFWSEGSWIEHPLTGCGTHG